MKKLVILALSLGLTTSGYSQMEKKASPAKSSSNQVGETTVTVNYSSPSKKGRDIFGGLVPYDKIWRTGANEATTLMVSQAVEIAGETLPEGTYALFTIPGTEEWTVILNSQSKQWGAYNYDEEKDVMRFTVPAQEREEALESFTIMVSEEGVVTLAWDKTEISFEVND
jgi:hypothetical protein